MKKGSTNCGYVYLLADFDKEGVYKIGVTRGTIERRMKKLQTGNSGEIYIINYYKTEHPFFVEKWMHIKYFGTKVKNEWFSMSIDEVSKFNENCKKFDELYQFTNKGKKEKNFDY